MGRKRNNQEQKKPNNQLIVDEKSFPWIPIITALITVLGLIIVALINRSTSLETTLKPIEATQTAEAQLTTIAMTITEGFAQTQIQMAIVSQTAFSGTQIALAITATEEYLAISETQTIEAQVFDTQTAVALAIPTPTENKPIRMEYTFVAGDTLEDISKKYVGSGLYASAIGRANCKPMPVDGDVLVIRFYSAQQGENIDFLAERFFTSPDFLRAINAIDDGVILLPTDQILILPGKCGN